MENVLKGAIIGGLMFCTLGVIISILRGDLDGNVTFDGIIIGLIGIVIGGFIGWRIDQREASVDRIGEKNMSNENILVNIPSSSDKNESTNITQHEIPQTNIIFRCDKCGSIYIEGGKCPFCK